MHLCQLQPISRSHDLLSSSLMIELAMMLMPRTQTMMGTNKSTHCVYHYDVAKTHRI
jgi:hypothetical protein